MKVHSLTALVPFAAAAAIAAATGGAMAGEVSVSFTDTAHFADAGRTPRGEQATLDALAGHLQALGQRLLPAGQRLTVEVLDVDLAGTVHPFRGAGGGLRIVDGGADWPRIKLRYALQANGQALLSGEETVADMNHLRGLSIGRSSEPLQHEKQMLEAWFKARFVERRPIAG